MLDLLKFAYAWVLPPGIFVVLILATGVLGLFRGWKGVKWVFLTAVLIWALSLRAVAGLLCQPLEEAVPMPTSEEIESCDALVMTGAGLVTGVPDVEGEGQPGPLMAKGMLVAHRLQTRTGLPLIVSGGATGEGRASEADIALRILEQMGIPKDKLIPEKQSRNTAENARYTKEVLEGLGLKRPLVISPAMHAPRVRALFAREGVDAVLFPSHHVVSGEREFSPLRDLAPRMESLGESAYALREYLAHLAIRLGLY